MFVISVVLVCGIAVYELRYTLWGMPYDWDKIQSVGCLRVAAIEGDSVFVRQVMRFAEAKKLKIEVKYCSHKDELWFRLCAYKSDLVRFPNDSKEYSWKTRHNSHELQDSVDLWYDRNVRYISKWDGYFRQYGDSIGWDWKLLAAVGYVESRFKNVNSSTGLGIMQLSRNTASRFGVSGVKVTKPNYNIEAASKYIMYLDDSFSMVEDRNERIKFVLAAYNSGRSRVGNAMTVTKRHKKNEYKWNDVAKYFHNNHSKKYLKDILAKYEEYCIKE
ncbi:MAG: transglycosylase SLT domain-containing protein [Paludibacteraceae bacterium]|nr:transglycosylase SLT domain-containing protein [Paludibacteraceae bacterium]